MVNKYFFEKYSDKKIVFLTKNLYRTVSGENKKTPIIHPKSKNHPESLP